MTESNVRKHFQEVIPEVFVGKILTDNTISKMRNELTRIASSGIPTRRPNGMNRFGIIPDLEVDGGVSNGIDMFVADLVDQYVRPILQTLFPKHINIQDTTEWFAFTIQYNASGNNGDRSLAEHRDASVATLNLNLNSQEEFTAGLNGSALYFVDENDRNKRKTVLLKPGMALLHRGGRRHAAEPLAGHGLRLNLVIWLFGKDGYVRDAEYDLKDRMTSSQRWNGQSWDTNKNMFYNNNEVVLDL
jgi:hypothetical protein